MKCKSLVTLSKSEEVLIHPDDSLEEDTLLGLLEEAHDKKNSRPCSYKG